MIRRACLLAGGLSVSIVGCAPALAPRVIEPPAMAEFDESSGGGGDEAFVLSRDPARAVDNMADAPVHLEAAWYSFRAQFLSISPEEARARDRRIAATRPPLDFWDRQTATEAVSVWSTLCNECHGGRRKLSDALDMPAPARDWGVGEGLFFGRRRPYVEIFATITDGGPTIDGVESEMPDWADRLSREQIWSLVYFLEYQSGGIEGRFPPSLYPRSAGDP